MIEEYNDFYGLFRCSTTFDDCRRPSKGTMGKVDLEAV